MSHRGSSRQRKDAAGLSECGSGLIKPEAAQPRGLSSSAQNRVSSKNRARCLMRTRASQEDLDENRAELGLEMA